MVGRDSRVSRDFLRSTGPLESVARFLRRYIVIPDTTLLVVSAWVIASWLVEVWDRFPHLAVMSPEKRCGKTRFLQLIGYVTRDAYHTTNISPAAMYRLIESKKPTLLLDESQSLVRRGSEQSEVIREILNAGIDRKAKILRCGGQNMTEIEEFYVYSPKVIAMIGALDGVLADRCLAAPLKRKTDTDDAIPVRSRKVEPEGADVAKAIEAWTVKHRDRIQAVYDELEPFPIPNDRLAELLLPLQAVLVVIEEVELPGIAELKKGSPTERPDGPLAELRRYADGLEEEEKQAERMTPGVRILSALREILAKFTTPEKPLLCTAKILSELCGRSEEPWGTFVRGQGITAEALANLLRPYGISSKRNRDQSARGYVVTDFADAWKRYLPPLPALPRKNSSNPAIPATVRSK